MTTAHSASTYDHWLCSTPCSSPDQGPRRCCTSECRDGPTSVTGSLCHVPVDTVDELDHVLFEVTG